MRLEGWLYGVGLFAMFTAIPAVHAEEAAQAAPPADESVPAPAPLPATPSRMVADPWLTRTSVSFNGGMTQMNASIPVAALETEYAGESQSGALSIDVYGRRIGFHLFMGGGASENVNAPVEGVVGQRFTHAEGALGLGLTLIDSHGIYLSAGPAIEGRATAVGYFEQGNEAVASWQSVVGGGSVNARVFVGPYVYLTGSAFAGVVPVSGGWQSVDAAGAFSNPEEPVGSANLAESSVLGAQLAASVRPVSFVAVTGGVAMREAAYAYDDGSTGSERTVRPYVALELLF